jgi:hypothetical protein
MLLGVLEQRRYIPEEKFEAPSESFVKTSKLAPKPVKSGKLPDLSESFFVMEWVRLVDRGSERSCDFSCFVVFGGFAGLTKDSDRSGNFPDFTGFGASDGSDLKSLKSAKPAPKSTKQEKFEAPSESFVKTIRGLFMLLGVLEQRRYIPEGFVAYIASKFVTFGLKMSLDGHSS